MPIKEATLARIEKQVAKVATKEVAKKVAATIERDAKYYALGGKVTIEFDLEIAIGNRDYSFDLRTGELTGSGMAF
jgi:hypothetical protein